jgi:hypothetical protein
MAVVFIWKQITGRDSQEARRREKSIGGKRPVIK